MDGSVFPSLHGYRHFLDDGRAAWRWDANAGEHRDFVGDFGFHWGPEGLTEAETGLLGAVAFTSFRALPFVPDIGGVHREAALVLGPGRRCAFSVTHPAVVVPGRSGAPRPDGDPLVLRLPALRRDRRSQGTGSEVRPQDAEVVLAGRRSAAHAGGHARDRAGP